MRSVWSYFLQVFEDKSKKYEADLIKSILEQLSKELDVTFPTQARQFPFECNPRLKLSNSRKRSSTDNSENGPQIKQFAFDPNEYVFTSESTKIKLEIKIEDDWTEEF